MTINQIVKYIAKKEGKKHEASVGDIREIVGILSDLLFHSRGALIALLENGQTRFDKSVKAALAKHNATTKYYTVAKSKAGAK